jgi:hypothetical protein
MSVVLHGYKQFASSPLNMEGNLSYAMLKAMESGASAYFILSYANTELLKEDEVLSQNYSVRYDIWQERLVEIYQELNAVLADVQTKLIVNHEVLNLNAATNTVRVPDQDELLKDVEQMAQNKKEEIANKVEAERLAKLNAVRTARDAASNAVVKVTEQLANAQKAYESVLAQLETSDSAVATAFAAATASGASDAEIAALESALKTYVVKNATEVYKQVLNAMKEILAAKAGYNFLKEAADIDAQLIAEARANLVATIDQFAAIYGVLMDQTFTFDATPWIDDANNNDIGSLVQIITAGAGTPGSDSLVMVLADLQSTLTGAGLSINLNAMLGEELAKLPTDNITYTPIVIVPVELESTQSATVNKYKVDNNVVAVTYGESRNEPTKTLLLNFNDYTIRTTYNGVTYTIAAYDYVVIKY